MPQRDSDWVQQVIKYLSNKAACDKRFDELSHKARAPGSADQCEFDDLAALRATRIIVADPGVTTALACRCVTLDELAAATSRATSSATPLAALVEAVYGVIADKNKSKKTVKLWDISTAELMHARGEGRHVARINNLRKMRHPALHGRSMEELTGMLPSLAVADAASYLAAARARAQCLPPLVKYWNNVCKHRKHKFKAHCDKQRGMARMCKKALGLTTLSSAPADRRKTVVLVGDWAFKHSKGQHGRTRLPERAQQLVAELHHYATVLPIVEAYTSCTCANPKCSSTAEDKDADNDAPAAAAAGASEDAADPPAPAARRRGKPDTMTRQRVDNMVEGARLAKLKVKVKGEVAVDSRTAAAIGRRALLLANHLGRARYTDASRVPEDTNRFACMGRKSRARAEAASPQTPVEAARQPSVEEKRELGARRDSIRRCISWKQGCRRSRHTCCC